MKKAVLTLCALASLMFAADAKVTGDVEKNVWVEPIKSVKVKVEKKEPAAKPAEPSTVNILMVNEGKTAVNKTIKRLREAILEAENIKDRDFDFIAFKGAVKSLMQEVGSFQ